MNAVEQTAERIIRPTWDEDYYRAPSNIWLVREYYRRAALWAGALQCVEAWPYFDVALKIEPSIRANQTIVGNVELFLENHVLLRHHTMKTPLLSALHWAALTEQRDVSSKNGLPEPYEPMLLAFDRGAFVYFHHGFVEVGGGAFSKGNWESYLKSEPLAKLDLEWLDQIDKETHAKRGLSQTT